MTAIEVSPEEMKKLEEKKAKKEKKKAKKDKRKHDDDDDEEKDKEDDASDDETKNDRSQKRDEKKKLMALVPERDADGIAYTKMQRRRMMKRVKRGLDPVPTPHEEAERIKNDAQLKRDEEAELSGMMFVREEDEDDDDDDEEMEDKEDDDSPAAPAAAAKSPFDDPNAFKPNVFNKKRKLSNKPVPADYICSACQNKNDPLHWIYDCPDKITKRGTNQVSKKQKGVHDPDSKKVFVSGLSFEAKRKDVEALFASCGGKIVQCKLLTFEDTGRCKGQAYLTFDSESSAKKALALSGTTFENTVAAESSKKGETKEIKRKELKLKVTKMLNRSATKQGSRY